LFPYGTQKFINIASCTFLNKFGGSEVKITKKTEKTFFNRGTSPYFVPLSNLKIMCLRPSMTCRDKKR